MNHGITIGVVKKEQKNTISVSNELEYIANLTQVADDIIVTVLKNDFGVPIVWQKEATEHFSANIPNYKFMQNRTTIVMNKPTSGTKIYRKNTSTILLECPEQSLKETTVKISVIELNGLFSQEFNNLFN